VKDDLFMLFVCSWHYLYPLRAASSSVICQILKIVILYLSVNVYICFYIHEKLHSVNVYVEFDQLKVACSNQPLK